MFGKGFQASFNLELGREIVGSQVDALSNITSSSPCQRSHHGNQRHPPIVFFVFLNVACQIALTGQGCIVADEEKGLVGKWVRDSGGYELKVLEVPPAGKLKASYWNPRYAKAINVCEAKLEARGGKVRIYVGLDDDNCDGDYYDIVYDSALDKLSGEYHQFSNGKSHNVHKVTFSRFAN